MTASKFLGRTRSCRSFSAAGVTVEWSSLIQLPTWRTGQQAVNWAMSRTGCLGTVTHDQVSVECPPGQAQFRCDVMGETAASSGPSPSDSSQNNPLHVWPVEWYTTVDQSTVTYADRLHSSTTILHRLK